MNLKTGKEKYMECWREKREGEVMQYNIKNRNNF